MRNVPFPSHHFAINNTQFTQISYVMSENVFSSIFRFPCNRIFPYRMHFEISGRNVKWTWSCCAWMFAWFSYPTRSKKLIEFFRESEKNTFPLSPMLLQWMCFCCFNLYLDMYSYESLMSEKKLFSCPKHIPHFGEGWKFFPLVFFPWYVSWC